MDLVTAATGPFTPTDVHTRLAKLVGVYAGTARTYADPDNPAAFESAPWDAHVEMVLGGRFLRMSYVSRAMGQPIAGELTVAYEKGDRLFRMSWIDSLHTSPAILVSQGDPSDDAAATIRAFGTYFAGEGQPRWGWRTVLDDHTPGSLRIQMFNVTPGGEESLGVEIELTRAA